MVALSGLILFNRLQDRVLNPFGTNKEELMRMAAEHPDWYLQEFAEAFNVCHQAIQQMFKRLGVTHKKTSTYSEKSEDKRKEYLRQAAQISEGKQVYVGECGINTHL
ncbi:MAG: transposase [Treponema sp.]|nr:transposase [Treponema sp.]